MKRKSYLRTIVQILFFILIGVIAVTEIASLHALCPFGGVVTLYNLVTVGTFIQQTHLSSIILLGLVLLLAILFGPVFCGWVCPLGSLEEWIGKLGKKIFPHKFNRFVPEKADRILRYLRIAVLVWVVYITAKSATLVFANIDPYNALFSFWTGEVALPAIIILIVTLVLSLFVARPWCRYLCPYGALLGFFNKIRVFSITRHADTCITCGRCDKACPMRIPVSARGKVADLQCISCFECTSEGHCPVKDTVELRAGRPRDVQQSGGGVADEN